jgi:hypothetical protein
MSLREQQSKFALMLGKLIVFAYEQGFEITMGDVWAKTGHKENSAHYRRMAADLNLFKDGKWLSDGTGHDVLHDYWDTLGGSKRLIRDMNHYSLGE